MNSQVENSIGTEAKTSFADNPAIAADSKYSLSDLKSDESLSSVTAKSTEANFCIKLISEEDTENVIDFLKSSFFKDEPLNKYIDLKESKELEEYCIKCIPEKLSFKAVNNRGEIIGVFLSTKMHKVTQNQHTLNHKEKKFGKILSLMDFIDTKFKIFDLYPDEDIILDGKILAVDSNYRGLGVAGKLTEYILQLMSKNGIRVMHVLCTSYYSARVLEKLNFREVFRLAYKDYRVNGEVIFNPESPHHVAKILVKEM